MADSKQKAAKQLREITECPICMNAFNDPRMLPCIHTFCFECLKRTSDVEQKKPRGKMPCPLCRKEFVIPADGINGVQKNFFMENLLQYKMTLQTGAFDIICDICNESKTGEIPRATMRCLDCQDNYCESCGKVHKFQKISRNHLMVKIGSDTVTSGDRPKYVFSVKYCSKHTQKPLDYYCAECREIVCVSCFVEGHKSHDCKDIATVDKEFRQMIEVYAWKIANYADEMLAVKANVEKRKADFLKEIAEKENAIHKRNQELKEIIDGDTESLLDELSVVKSNLLKKMEDEVEIIDTGCTIRRSFEAYCTELKVKGSGNDICCSIDELIARAGELENDHEIFIKLPRKSVDVSFRATDLKEVSQKFNFNIVGQIEETTKYTQFENCAIVVGLDNGLTRSKDVFRITLHRLNDFSAQAQIPTTMLEEAVGAVYCNTLYVAGVGSNADEIWKYNMASGWIECASLVQGRSRHSAAFIDEVLYVFGGYADFDESVLDSVEAYNAVTNTCTEVGKLVHGVESSGSCVAVWSSLYIFGGTDENYKAFNHVQVYNAKENTCSVLQRPMPRPFNLMRAVLLGSSVILLGWGTCLIFDLETETWKERKWFKTDVVHFGLVVNNKRIFVIGGGDSEMDKNGKTTWKCRDEIRSVPLQNILNDKPVEWRIHGRLPKPSLVDVCANMRFLV